MYELICCTLVEVREQDADLMITCIMLQSYDSELSDKFCYQIEVHNFLNMIIFQ